MRSTQVLCTCDWCGLQETCPYTGNRDRLEIPAGWRLIQRAYGFGSETLMCLPYWTLCAGVLPNRMIKAGTA